MGSGNPGATNVGRALGPRAGRVVLVLDALKGGLPTLCGVAAFGAADPRTAAIGMAETNLSLLKSGKVKGMRFDTLAKLCRVLDCQPGDLLEFDSNGPDETD